MLESDPTLEKTHYKRLYYWDQINDSFLKYDGECPFCGFENISHDQITSVIKKLKEKPETRRAILTLWQPQDISDPYALCWTFAQILIRKGRVIMTVHFRSNDIYNAFPFNILGIAILHKKIADEVGVKCGDFNVVIGSAHIYNHNISAAQMHIDGE